MSNIGKGIKDLLVTDVAVFALVKNYVYPLVIPQGIGLPAVTYQIVSSTELECKAGTPNDQVRVQISAFAKTYEEVTLITKAVRAVLENYSGIRLASYPDPVRISAIRFAGTRDLYETDSKTFHQATDYLVHVRNS